MNLPIPVPSQTTGPQYALDEQSCFQQIDSHNHTPGQGSQIPLNALNVNQNLSMSGYSITALKSLKLNNQVISPGDSSLYMLGNNLYFSDGTGAFNVQITSGNAVAVSGAVGFSGLPSGTASAAYQSLLGAFRFQSATNTAATLDVGPVNVRNTLAGSNAVTLNAPNPLAANYSITFPAAVPPSDKILRMASTGDITNNLDVDNSTLEISSNVLKVKNLGIGTNQLADGSVTSAKLDPLALNVAPANRTPTSKTEIIFNYQYPTYPSRWTGPSFPSTSITNLILTLPYTPTRANVNLYNCFSNNGNGSFCYGGQWNSGGTGPFGSYISTCYITAIFQNPNITTTLLTCSGGTVNTSSRIVTITDTAPGNIYIYFTLYNLGAGGFWAGFTSNLIYNFAELN